MLDALGARHLVKDFTQRLAGREDLATTLALILDEAAQIVAHQSLALILDREGVLEVAASRGTARADLEAAVLARVEEPVVEAAWRKRATLRSTDAHRRGRRLFEGEAAAVAVYLQDQGVLYAGRREADDFTEYELNRLAVLAGQAGLAIQSARRSEAQRTALVQHAEAHARLDGWVARLQTLMEGSRAIASTLDAGRMLEIVEGLVRALVPHEAGIARAAATAGEVARRWGSWPATADENATVDLRDAAAANRRPFLLDDVAATRFRPRRPGCAACWWRRS